MGPLAAALVVIALSGGVVEPPTPVDNATAAKAEVRKAFDAAQAEDYDAAIGHFERALELKPTPRLHFNIAVIHHRKLQDLQEDEPDYETERRAAVDEYNEYLRTAKAPKDQRQVERTILSLGGRPATLDDWSVQPDEPPAEPPALQPEGDETEDEDPAARKPRRRPKNGPSARVGFGVMTSMIGIEAQAGTDDVATAPHLGGTIRGGAFLGPKGRLNLGGELALGIQPTRTESRHHVAAGFLAIAMEYGHPVGNRLEVGGGGLVGLIGESLRHYGNSTVTCPLDDGGKTKISDRGGLLLAGRFVLSFLLGKKKNHELALRLTPGVAFVSQGKRGSRMTNESECEDGPRPFDETGIDSGAELVVTFDVGYAPRF